MHNLGRGGGVLGICLFIKKIKHSYFAQSFTGRGFWEPLLLKPHKLPFPTCYPKWPLWKHLHQDIWRATGSFKHSHKFKWAGKVEKAVEVGGRSHARSSRKVLEQESTMIAVGRVPAWWWLVSEQPCLAHTTVEMMAGHSPSPPPPATIKTAIFWPGGSEMRDEVGTQGWWQHWGMKGHRLQSAAGGGPTPRTAQPSMGLPLALAQLRAPPNLALPWSPTPGMAQPPNSCTLWAPRGMVPSAGALTRLPYAAAVTGFTSLPAPQIPPFKKR